MPKFEARDLEFTFTNEERLATVARLAAQRKGRRSKIQREINADPERLAEQAEHELKDAFEKFLACWQCADLLQPTLPTRAEGVPRKRSERKTVATNKRPGPTPTGPSLGSEETATPKRRRVTRQSTSTPKAAQVTAPALRSTAPKTTAPTSTTARAASTHSRGKSGLSRSGLDGGSDPFETLLAEGIKAKRP